MRITSLSDHYEVVACEVSDEVIEMFVLGSLPDAEPELLEHLKTCAACAPRVRDAEQWARSLGQAFRDLGR